MVERRWPDTFSLHVVELHGPADTEDEESLPVSVFDHCSHHDLPWLHNTPGRES